MCIDYCSLNKITVKNRYHLPMIDDFLDQRKQNKFFIELDLKSGYHQVRIKEKNVWKTVVKTRKGLYKWLVIPIILCNAPTTFMRLMNDVLHHFINSFVIVYLDGILIFNNSWHEHISHVTQVLKILKKNQQITNLKKCEFGKDP
jgi:hypothetical protein